MFSRLTSELVRTAGFRLALALSVSFFALSCVLFGLIYWQATNFEDRRTGHFLLQEVALLKAQPVSQVRSIVESKITESLRGVSISALFSEDRRLLAGNLSHLPRDMKIDGLVHNYELTWDDVYGQHSELVRTVATTLSGNEILVVGKPLQDLIDLRGALARSLLLGLIPTLLLTLVVSAFVSWRALRHIKDIDSALEHIMVGNFQKRLPSRGTMDSVDRLVRSVNAMLDKIEVLLEELQDVGSHIAHELRTPLSKLRNRLERTRRSAACTEATAESLEIAIADLDHAAGVITALLRIGEVQDDNRRAGFQLLSLGEIMAELAEAYQPVAEESNILLVMQVDPTLHVFGDWDLLTEALANLIENALKFTPPGGMIKVLGFERSDGSIIQVADTGPGIPASDREKVFKRFYRSKRAQGIAGSGLGLSLVKAICRLHGYNVKVLDSRPGCVIEIVSPKEASQAGLSRALSGMSH